MPRMQDNNHAAQTAHPPPPTATWEGHQMPLRLLVTLVMVMGLTACASVASDATQTLSVTAVCRGELVQDAICTFRNDKGEWSVRAPGSLAVRPSYGDLTVTCVKEASTGSAQYQSKNTTAVWGNVLAGGVVGYMVDASRGAGFRYPATMTIVMDAPCPTPTHTQVKQ